MARGFASRIGCGAFLIFLALLALRAVNRLLATGDGVSWAGGTVLRRFDNAGQQQRKSEDTFEAYAKVDNVGEIEDQVEDRVNADTADVDVGDERQVVQVEKDNNVEKDPNIIKQEDAWDVDVGGEREVVQLEKDNNVEKDPNIIKQEDAWDVDVGGEREVVQLEKDGQIDKAPDTKKQDDHRLLCIIPLPSPKKVADVEYIVETWGRRCWKLVFVSNAADHLLGFQGDFPKSAFTVLRRKEEGAGFVPAHRIHSLETKHGTAFATIEIVPDEESTKTQLPTLNNLWPLLRPALAIVEQTPLFSNFSWLVKASIDTYVLPGNIVAYASDFALNPNDALFAGLVREIDASDTSKRGVTEPLLILSRPALAKLSPVLFQDTRCSHNGYEREARAMRECFKSAKLLQPTSMFDARGLDTVVVMDGPVLDWVGQPLANRTEELSSFKPTAFYPAGAKSQRALEGALFGTKTRDVSPYLDGVRSSLSQRYEPRLEWANELVSMPKKVHLSWRTSAILTGLPKNKYVQSIHNMIRLNPSWNVSIIEDDQVTAAVQAFLHNDDYERIKSRPFIEKLDLFRLIKIYDQGGFYQDIDRLYNIPFEEILTKPNGRDEIRCMLPTHYDVNFSQDVMLCTKGSAFHKLAIELNLKYRRQGEERVMALGPDVYHAAITRILIGVDGPEAEKHNRKQMLEQMRILAQRTPYLGTFREDGLRHSVAFDDLREAQVDKKYRINMHSHKSDLYRFSKVDHWTVQEKALNKSLWL